MSTRTGRDVDLLYLEIAVHAGGTLPKELLAIIREYLARVYYNDFRAKVFDYQRLEQLNRSERVPGVPGDLWAIEDLDGTNVPGTLMPDFFVARGNDQEFKFKVL